MLKHPYYTALFATLYLLVFVLLIQFQMWENLVYLLFFFSPLVVLSLAWSFLCHGKYNGRELSENEHWGYQDKTHEKA